MVKIDDLDILNQSLIEILNYFFANPNKAIGILKYNDDKYFYNFGETYQNKNLLYRANLLGLKNHALYFAFKKVYSDKKDIEKLGDSNFCVKALKLVPFIFNFKEEQLKERLQNIMQEAREGIDSMLGIKYMQNPFKYKKCTKGAAMFYLRQKFRNATDEELVDDIRKKYTLSEEYIKKTRLVQNASDRDLESPYMTNIKQESIELDKKANAEKIELLKLENEKLALYELRSVIEGNVFTYNDIFLIPSVVRNYEKNKHLIEVQEEDINPQFQELVNEIEKVGLSEYVISNS